MKKAMTVTYEVGENLYINVTNRCPCRCVFCIRNNDDGAYGSDPLWLEHEPTMEEMQTALGERNLDKYKEIVFCGYGEPLMRFTFVYKLAAYLKSIKPDIYIRLNTNGLVERYNTSEALEGGTSAASKIAKVIDKVSISLNGGTSEVYDRVTRPAGADGTAYEVMLAFAEECKACGMEVMFTVVDVITPEEIQAARQKADELGIPLEVRAYIS